MGRTMLREVIVCRDLLQCNGIAPLVIAVFSSIAAFIRNATQYFILTSGRRTV
jgi:hypothetical protein